MTYPPGQGQPYDPTKPMAPTDPWLPQADPGWPGAPAAGPAGHPPPVPPDAGPVVVRIGEIEVTSSTVRTPAGQLPLAGSNWQVADYWHNEQKTPTWAIVAAVVGFCVLTVFSLLFLLVKKTVYHGTVQVTVTNGSRQYVARIPVTDQAAVQQVHQQVNYVRSLAAL